MLKGQWRKTFIICSERWHFTTNFHGIIISPLSKEFNLSKSIFIGIYLYYLRHKNVLDKLSVGSQGGSFAVGYWDNILIPNFDDSLLQNICRLYHSDQELNPFIFEFDQLINAGLFELNNFRILCNEILYMIVSDIKNNRTNSLNHYQHLFTYNNTV